MARLNDSRIGTLLGDRYGVRASARTASSLHAQHGTALFVTLEAPLTVVDAHGRITRGRAVLVPPHLEHTVDSPGATIGICYDPERLPRVTARSHCAPTAHALDGRLAHKLVEQALAHRGQLAQLDVLSGIADEAAAWIATDTMTPGAARIDSRVAAVVEAMGDDSEVPRLPISRAHLAELFVRDIGVPIRSYRLWRRLLRAILAFAHTDATTAAHRAGFADLAHFSRTCRRMLGYTPTALRDGV